MKHKITKANVGAVIKTTDALLHEVNNKNWIVLKIGKNSYRTFVASAYINQQFKTIINAINKRMIFKYIKNKK